MLTAAGPTGGEPGPVSRRALLAASAALPLLLTACKGVQALGTPPPPAPDIVALRSAISAEEVMLARYAGALAFFNAPSDIALRTAVAAVQAEHAAHVAQLKSRLIEPPGSSPSPSPHASPTVPPAATIAAELTSLELAEQAASDRLIGQLDRLPASLAQLFASIAASEATHVPFLQAVKVPQ